MGLGSTEDVTFKVTVDASGAVVGFEKVKTALRETEVETERAKGGFSDLQAGLVAIDSALNIAGRAFGVLTGALRTLSTGLLEAAQIEGLENAFVNLQGGTANAAISIDALRESTKGLVSDLDLFKVANQAVLLGVDDGTGRFAELAGAAIQLGRAMGITALEAINSLTIGIGRQSKLVLDNLGVIVNTASAYEAFAATIGTTAEALTDQQRKLAFNEAATAAITEKVKSLTDVLGGAGIATTRVSATIDNLRKTFLTTLSANTSLTEAIDGFNDALKDLDIKAIAKDIGDLAAIAVKTVTAFTSLAGAISRLSRQRQLFSAGSSVDAFRQDLGVEAGRQAETLFAGLAFAPQTTKAVEQLQEAFAALEKRFESTNILVKARLRPIIEDLRLGLQQFEAGVIASAIATDELEEELDDVADAFKETEKKLKEFIDIGAFLADKIIKEKLNVEMGKLVEIFGQSEEQVGFLSEALKRLKGEFLAAGGDAALFDTVLQRQEITFDRIIKPEGDLSFGQQILESAFDFDFSEQTEQELAKELADALGQALAGAFDLVGQALKGETITGEAIGATLGLALGAIIGSSFGAPGVGAAIGSSIGAVIGSIFDSATTNAETLGRRAIEESIDNIIKFTNFRIRDAQGKVLRIEDIFLPEKGAFRADAEESPFQPFVDSAEDSKFAFTGIGIALADAIGAGFGQGIQVGAVALFQQLGGNIDNLKLLVRELGLTFEDAGQAIINAFDAGNISALEALTTFREIEKAFEPGLEAVGAFQQAFETLLASEVKGQLAQKAFADIFIEALESGISGLDELEAALEETGAFSAQEIEALFSAIEASGITSFEELIALSDRALIEILGNFQAIAEDLGVIFEPLGEGLDAANEKIERTRELIDGFPDQVETTLVINVRTDFQDENAEEALDAVERSFDGPGIPQ